MSLLRHENTQNRSVPSAPWLEKLSSRGHPSRGF